MTTRNNLTAKQATATLAVLATIVGALGLWVIATASIPVAAATGLLWITGAKIVFARAERIGREEAAKPQGRESHGPSILSIIKAYALVGAVTVVIVLSAMFSQAVFYAALATTLMALVIFTMSAFVIARAEAEARRAMS